MTNDIQLKNTVSTKGAGAKQPKKRRIASLDRRKARSGWLFVLPFVIGFVLIYLLCLGLLGLPVLIMEFALGRASQASPVKMYQII